MWITRRLAHMPIECLAVPMREMEINLGPDGEIDDRFVVRWVYNKYVRALLGDEIWGKIRSELRESSTASRPIARRSRGASGASGEDISDEVWQHVVLIDDELSTTSEIRARAAARSSSMRFNPTADWPWAHGPALQGLPTLRQVDELERQYLEATERSYNPAITYPDDSFAEVEQGIEPGMAYPVRVGSEGAVRRSTTSRTSTRDVRNRGDGKAAAQAVLRRLSRADRRHAADARPMARRAGARAAPHRHARHVVLARGAARDLPALQVSARGGRHDQARDRQRPRDLDPALQSGAARRRAAGDRDRDAVRADLGQMFPEEWRLHVDGGATIKAFIDKMRTGGLIKMRKPSGREGRAAANLATRGARTPGRARPPPEAGAPGP
jgi:hypothetical protein